MKTTSSKSKQVDFRTILMTTIWAWIITILTLLAILLIFTDYMETNANLLTDQNQKHSISKASVDNTENISKDLAFSTGMLQTVELTRPNDLVGQQAFFQKASFPNV